MDAINDQLARAQRKTEDQDIELKNLKKSLNMKDEMLQKMKGEVALKDMLDKEIA